MSTPESTTEPREGASRAPWPVRAWTWLVAIGGAALAVVATSELAGGDADGGVSWLLLAGVFLLVGPFVFDRLTSPSVPTASASTSARRWPAKARSTAARIDRWGGGLSPNPPPPTRPPTPCCATRPCATPRSAQDHFVDAAAASALVQRYDADEVRTLFRHGPPVIRVLALGLMIGDPSPADAATIESAITEFTANEQYHGCAWPRWFGRRLPPEDRRRLRRAIEREPIPCWHARTHLRASVLVMLADEPGADEPEADQGDDGGEGPTTGRACVRTRPRRSATGAPPTGRPGRTPRLPSPDVAGGPCRPAGRSAGPRPGRTTRVPTAEGQSHGAEGGSMSERTPGPGRDPRRAPDDWLERFTGSNTRDRACSGLPAAHPPPGPPRRRTASAARRTAGVEPRRSPSHSAGRAPAPAEPAPMPPTRTWDLAPWAAPPGGTAPRPGAARRPAGARPATPGRHGDGAATGHAPAPPARPVEASTGTSGAAGPVGAAIARRARRRRRAGGTGRFSPPSWCCRGSRSPARA